MAQAVHRKRNKTKNNLEYLAGGRTGRANKRKELLGKKSRNCSELRKQIRVTDSLQKQTVRQYNGSNTER